MRYVPSPIEHNYKYIYTATANQSGRMQYHKIKTGVSKVRISRAEFIKAFNSAHILSMQPLQLHGNDQAFQIEFYI